MEPTTSSMVDWLDQRVHFNPEPDRSMARAIRDRLQSDAERIAELINDCDEYQQQARDAHTEAVCLTK